MDTSLENTIISLMMTIFFIGIYWCLMLFNKYLGFAWIIIYTFGLCLKIDNK